MADAHYDEAFHYLKTMHKPLYTELYGWTEQLYRTPIFMKDPSVHEGPVCMKDPYVHEGPLCA